MSTPAPLPQNPRGAKRAGNAPRARSKFVAAFTIQDDEQRKNLSKKTYDAVVKTALTFPVRLGTYAVSGTAVTASGSWALGALLGATLGLDVAATVWRAKIDDRAATAKREEQLKQELDPDTDQLEQLKEARDRIAVLEALVEQQATPVGKIETLEDKQLDQGQKLGQVSQAAHMTHNKVEAHDQQLTALRKQSQEHAAQLNEFGGAVRQAFDNQSQHFEQLVQQAVAAEIHRLQSAGVITPAGGQAAAGVPQPVRPDGPPPETHKGPIARLKDGVARLRGREPELTPRERYFQDQNEDLKRAGLAQAAVESTERQQMLNGQPPTPYQTVQNQNAPAAPWHGATGHGYAGAEAEPQPQAAPGPAKRGHGRPRSLGQTLTRRASKKGPSQS